MEATERICVDNSVNEGNRSNSCPSFLTGVTEHMINRKKRHRSSDSEMEAAKTSAGCLSLPPEVEEGKFEYKLKLVAPSNTRFEHLVTQMKWRLQEGAGEAIYEIGVEDCGTYIGLKKNELQVSMQTLFQMAERLGATTKELRRISLEDDRTAVEVLVRKVPDDQQFLDLRIAVLGNADSGKSTLVGVLAHGELDNGSGKARLNLFRHRHEIQSGRTSSISQEIIGFDSEGELKNYSENNTAEEICENSSKIIHFIDVPGHQKYLKTTIFGLMGHSPHFAMLVMSANTGIVGTTREQLGLALCLQVPLFVVVTKVDCCRKAVLHKNLANMERLLKSPGCKKIPFRIENEADAVNAATNMNSDKVVPVFMVSSKTGAGMDLLQKFLNVLPPTANSKELEKLTAAEEFSFHVDDVFTDVPDVGLVVAGIVKKGCIREDAELLAGPMKDGSFTKVKVASMHRNRVSCRLVKAGQAAGLALTAADGVEDLPAMRKGMVLTSVKSCPPVCNEFEAEINLLFHKKSIKEGFQCTVHVASVCQTAEILEMSTKTLETNGKATVKFKFLQQPECIYEGSKLLFRQGTTRGIGNVTKVTPIVTSNSCDLQQSATKGVEEERTFESMLATDECDIQQDGAKDIYSPSYQPVNYFFNRMLWIAVISPSLDVNDTSIIYREYCNLCFHYSPSPSQLLVQFRSLPVKYAQLIYLAKNFSDHVTVWFGNNATSQYFGIASQSTLSFHCCVINAAYSEGRATVHSSPLCLQT